MTVLDTPASSGPPAATFPTVGDSFTAGIVNIQEFQQTDYDTGEPKRWANGDPVMGKRITCLVTDIGGDFCSGGIRNPQPVAAGELVTLYIQGGLFTAYRDATRKHNQPITVGDVCKVTRLEDGEPSNPRYNPPKRYQIGLRANDPAKDGDLKARCEAAYHASTSITVDTPAAPAAADDMEDF